MEFFALNDDLAACELQLLHAAGEDRCDLMAALAWHLRQRDTHRALRLVEELEQLPLEGRPVVACRALLVRAEAKWLDGNLDEAAQLLQQVQAAPAAANDVFLAGDALWLEASLARDRGNTVQMDQLLEQASALYASSGDTLRVDVARIRRIYNAAFVDPQAAWSALQLGGFLERQEDRPAALAWLESAKALMAPLQGGNVAAIAGYLRAYDAALISGQVRLAITAANNAGGIFDDLNDLKAALRWRERALEQARAVAWPHLLGTCLSQTANILRGLGNFEAAKLMLMESLSLLAPNSRGHAIALDYLGNVCLAMGDAGAAVHWFEQAQAQSEAQKAYHGQVSAQRGSAQALLAQGHAQEAYRMADSARHLAQKYGLYKEQISALCVMAELHRRHPLPFSSPLVAATPAMQCLEEALALASEHSEFIVPSELLETLAAECAQQHDMARAYSLALQAGRSREQSKSREASNRAAALQVRLETDELRRTNRTLEQLSAVGREIAEQRETQAIVALLQSRAVELIGAVHLIYLEWQSESQNGLQLLLQCGRTRKSCRGVISHMATLAEPLLHGDQLLGVMAVQARAGRDWEAREVFIFRTLCAYVAVALANARAMAELRTAQAELLQKNAELERLATTDRLTGLFNRRYLDMVLERETSTAHRYKQSFSVILLDLDHFKQVNDTLGHHAGDSVLVQVAVVLKGRVRDSDIPGRWGGEEFMVVCPGTTQADAMSLAELLRERIAGADFAEVGPRTASLGVASYRPQDTLQTLVERADRGLYQAKSAGRNQVACVD